jgi:hypothetical protein
LVFVSMGLSGANPQLIFSFVHCTANLKSIAAVRL